MKKGAQKLYYSIGEVSENHRASFVLSHPETEAGIALQYLFRDFEKDMVFLDGHQPSLPRFAQ